MALNVHMRLIRDGMDDDDDGPTPLLYSLCHGLPRHSPQNRQIRVAFPVGTCLQFVPNKKIKKKL